MSRLDDHLKDSKRVIEPRADLTDKIMEAVHELPPHKRHSWHFMSLVWAMPVVVALLAVVVIASPVTGKLDLNIVSSHSNQPTTTLKSGSPKTNSNGSTGSGNSNTNASTNTGSTSTSSDDASLNSGLSDIGNSINENQESLDAAGTAISDQQLDTPPSN
jgi:hypothetical protein